jgi:hypothetical protein
VSLVTDVVGTVWPPNSGIEFDWGLEVLRKGSPVSFREVMLFVINTEHATSLLLGLAMDEGVVGSPSCGLAVDFSHLLFVKKD